MDSDESQDSEDADDKWNIQEAEPLKDVDFKATGYRKVEAPHGAS